MKKPILKRTNYLIILSSLSFLLLMSCQSPIKRKITNKGIKQDIIEIEDRIEEVTPIQISFLNYIQKYYQETTEANELVGTLEKSRLSYKTVFTLLDSLEIKLIPYELERNEIIEDIDSSCTEIQNTIDFQQELRDSLNNIVIPNLLIASKTVWDKYEDVIELKVMIKNNSDKLIKKVTFDLIFINSKNVEFHIPCEYEGNLTIKKVRDFIFDEKEHEDHFNLLNSLELPVFISSYQVKSITYTDGNSSSIDSRYFYSYIYKDKYYSSPDEKVGYCPYLTKYDELNILLQNINDKYMDVIEKKAPFLKDFFIKYLENNINE